MLKIIDHFVTNMGGRKKDRLPFWNATDDNPRLACARWEINTTDGVVTISGYEQKQGVDWPEYPCDGDYYRNKFSVVVVTKKDGIPAYRGSGLLDISPENVQLHLGPFQGKTVKGEHDEHIEGEG